ncbi:MAG TPA: histidine phosphatase family protein [Deinococcales bacterium]|nr:histidine phosphatase family protein [Deinococcales bacterium]
MSEANLLVKTVTARREDTVEAWLVRHGETTWNVEGRWQGQGDAPLTPDGELQAQRLAARLAGQAFTAVYASDLPRAFTTARAITSRLAHPAEPQPEPGLREIHVGRISGLTTPQAELEHPGLTRLGFEDPYPDGESRAGLSRRIDALLRDLAARHRETPGARLLLVTHGGVIRAAVALALGDPSGASLAGRLGRVQNGSITRLALSVDGRYRLLSFNNTLDEGVTPAPMPAANGQAD